jgi:hypothetical protein
MSESEPLSCSQKLAKLWEFDESIVRRMFRMSRASSKAGTGTVEEPQTIAWRHPENPRLCGQTGL